MKSEKENGSQFSYRDFPIIYFTFVVTSTGNRAFGKSLNNAALSSKE